MTNVPCSTTAAIPPREMWSATQLVLAVLARREEHDVRARPLAHRVDERIVGVQHGVSLALRHGRDHALHVRQLLDRVDAAQPEMVGRHVQHDADVRLVEAESRAQNPAARRLEHGDVDRRDS